MNAIFVPSTDQSRRPPVPPFETRTSPFPRPVQVQPSLQFPFKWLAHSFDQEPLLFSPFRDMLIPMNSSYTAIVKKDGDWWIGWIEEVPGVNAQGDTKEKLLSSLKEILREALEFNRSEARQAAENDYTEEPVAV